MGVIHDYFRAPDAAAAMAAINLPGGPLSSQSLFDGVATKGIDPVLMLGQLLALIRQVPWEPDISSSKTLWPPPDTKPSSELEYKELPQDSPWKTGPWLWELGLQVRDNLASVEDAGMPDLAARWAEVDGFRGLLLTDDAGALIRDLVGLARRAREAGDRLYCWTCL